MFRFFCHPSTSSIIWIMMLRYRVRKPAGNENFWKLLWIRLFLCVCSWVNHNQHYSFHYCARRGTSALKQVSIFLRSEKKERVCFGCNFQKPHCQWGLSNQMIISMNFNSRRMGLKCTFLKSTESTNRLHEFCRRERKKWRCFFQCSTAVWYLHSGGMIIPSKNWIMTWLR